MLANWLQYYGPLTLAEIEVKLGITAEILVPVLAELETERTIIQGQLITDDEVSSTQYWCDAANFEILLRQLRHQRRELAEAEFEPLTLTMLPAFLYRWQTKSTAGSPSISEDASIEALFNLVERLRCYPAAVASWESEIFPSRLKNYHRHHLDSLMREGNLAWIGQGDKQVQWCFEEDLDLITPELEGAGLTTLIPGATGRYEFGAIADYAALSSADTAAALWQSAWRGLVSTDSFNVIRQGITSKFSLPDIQPVTSRQRRGIRRGGFNQWKSSIPSAGAWYQVAYPDSTSSLIENEELNKERVRLLIDRYGILFRELLMRELPTMNWRTLFRSIRLMELAGEITQGYFFKEIPGPQFVSPAALRELHQWNRVDTRQTKTGNRQKDTFWINAADPISLSGIGIDALKGIYPRRIASNHIVYNDSKVVLVSEKNGRQLTINVPDTDPLLPSYFEVFRSMLYRSFQPKSKVTIETINNHPARKSEYLPKFEACFDVVKDHKAIYLQRTL
jgi:ATP-dependent Lhr-like helicase